MNKIGIVVLLCFFQMVAFASETSVFPCEREWADWNYLTSYGQSLSVGWTAKPVVTETRECNGLYMFKSGVRSYENESDRSSLIFLKEGVNGPRGETPVSGAACRFFHLLSQRNPEMAEHIRLICSATGVGGASISSLGKGTDAYKRILDDLSSAKALADCAGKTLAMPAFIWTQGETDHQNGKTKEWYREKMEALIRDINQDAKSITGQKKNVICFGYQVASHLNYYRFNPTDYPAIALVQLDMALENGSQYVMTTPMYHFEYSDGVHLTAPMSRLYGEYVGYVMKKVLLDGEAWKPIHPQNWEIKRSGNTWIVEIAFYTPQEPLVLDTKTVDDPGNYGFSLVGVTGDLIPIKSVRLVASNTVRLETNKDPRNARLRYGMTLNEHRPSGPRSGARGCLRDSQGDTIKANIQGKDYRMDNWCPFFDYSLSKETIN